MTWEQDFERIFKGAMGENTTGKPVARIFYASSGGCVWEAGGREPDATFQGELRYSLHSQVEAARETCTKQG